MACTIRLFPQVISSKHEVPMLLKRQKPKEYGTCKTMEGHYKAGQTVAIVDDVLMTGGTFVEDIPVSCCQDFPNCVYLIGW